MQYRQKQPPRGIPWESCSENMQQIYRRTCRKAISIKLLCNFTEVTLQHGCSPVNLLHIFRTPFLRTPLDSCFYIDVLKNLTKFTAKFM